MCATRRASASTKVRPRSAEAWLLPDTRYTPRYLDAGGTLEADAPGEAGSVSYDSTAANTETGRAQFRARFDGDTEVTGYMKLKLWVSAADADDMDLFIAVSKFDRRSNEVHFPDFNHIEHGRVAKGWLRVSHRELDEARTTPYRPWLKHQRELRLVPGEIVPVEIEIWPSSTIFKAGESLELTIQGGDYTYVKSNPLPVQHGRMPVTHVETRNRGMHVIHAGGEYDSHLLLPVI